MSDISKSTPQTMPQTALPAFAYLLGKPPSTGLLRSQMSDFKVFEMMPYEPIGEGEHLYIHIRKTGCNTLFVLKELAKYFGVKEGLVSYAGLKDRFAVTEQWFGVHVPGKKVYDLSSLSIEGVEVLSAKRHNKKLRIGSLSGNRFELTLKKVSDTADVLRRWHAVCEHGVPNYFGEQRFGINGGNIGKSEALFSGTKVKDKKKRGIYLSAARSLLFNQVIHQRIEQSTFDIILPGDVMMLAGTQSVFNVELPDETLHQRLKEKDIDITGPMWGAGELKTQNEALELETKIAQQYPLITQGLPKFGLKQERRKMRITLQDTHVKSVDEETLIFTFSLPAGCYATSVLRELIDYTDMTERVSR